MKEALAFRVLKSKEGHRCLSTQCTSAPPLSRGSEVNMCSHTESSILVVTHPSSKPMGEAMVVPGLFPGSPSTP